MTNYNLLHRDEKFKLIQKTIKGLRLSVFNNDDTYKVFYASKCGNWDAPVFQFNFEKNCFFIDHGLKQLGWSNEDISTQVEKIKKLGFREVSSEEEFNS